MPRRNEDPLWAVASPPQADAIRARLGLEADDQIDVDLRGWSKRVALTDDLALLFPRDHTHIDALAREARALRAVATANLAEVPRLVDEWNDPALSPYPILVVTRLRGASLESQFEEITPDALASVLERTATLAAQWHTCDPKACTADRDFATPITQLFGDASPSDAASALCRQLDVQPRHEFTDAVAFARTLPHVLLHGDLHEAQLLVADGTLTGVIDWQTATIGHPYLEFNFGEWGTRIWRERRGDLPGLRRRQWTAYAATRDLDAAHLDVFEWVWCAHQLAVTQRNEANGVPRPDITGSVAEARAAFEAASATMIGT